MTNTETRRAHELRYGDIFYVEMPNGATFTEIVEAATVYDDFVYVIVAGQADPYQFHVNEEFQVEN